MSRNDLHSQCLDLLRFPLAIIVLIVHAGDLWFFYTPQNFNTSIFTKVGLFTNGFLRGYSVPIYFFISGFVFFLGVEFSKKVYFQKLRNRVKTLLIPYLIWNFLAVLLALLLNINQLSHFSLSSFLSAFWNTEGIFSPSTNGISTWFSAPLYPANFPLWFLRDLMIVVVCTPILYWIIKRTRYYFVLLLGIFWFSLAYWNLGHINQMANAFFFFSWGAYMSINQKDMIAEFSRFSKPSLLLYPLLALLFILSTRYFPELSATIKRVNILIGLLFAYNVAYWLLRHNICKVNPFLASSSFFIYVAHTLFYKAIVRVGLLFFHPTSDWGIFTLYLSTLLATIASLLLAFYLLRRYTPNFLKVIAGRK